MDNGKGRFGLCTLDVLHQNHAVSRDFSPRSSGLNTFCPQLTGCGGIVLLRRIFVDLNQCWRLIGHDVDGSAITAFGNFGWGA